jgi:hypothetical protein
VYVIEVARGIPPTPALKLVGFAPEYRVMTPVVAISNVHTPSVPLLIPTKKYL